MTVNQRRLLATFILLLFPYLLVLSLKKVGIASSTTVPLYRQKGPANAKAVIIEYSDFQCPVCARVQPSVEDLFKAYDGKVRIAFKHFPLQSIHPNALSAAQAAECAGEQAAFWPYAQMLYEKQPIWSGLQNATTTYLQFADTLKLKQPEFETCLKDERVRKRILNDTSEARTLGINSTPTFYVGHEQVVGSVFMADGARLIEKALRQ